MRFEATGHYAFTAVLDALEAGLSDAAPAGPHNLILDIREHHGLEHNVSGASASRPAELVVQAAVRHQRQALCRQGWTSDVVTQVLEPFAIRTGAADGRGSRRGRLRGRP